MKKITVLILMCIAMSAGAQKSTLTTESFTVEGNVKESKTFTLADLSSLALITKDSIVIKNHLQGNKNIIKNIKGVLLKDVLTKVVIDQESPRLLSEYYIVCIAADNYKVVFSWNEIFNNETGNQVLIMTSHDGKTGTEMKEHIALLTLSDIATGRRYVKGLQKIIIERTK